ILLIAAAAFMILAYPMLSAVVAVHSLVGLFIMQAIAAVLLAAFAGPAPAVLAEVFPTAVRSSGISIAYTLAVTIFGGFAPFIATWLIAATGDKVSPSWYVTGSAAVSLVLIAVFYRDRRGVAFSEAASAG
ncbi:MAG: MFS transporter, partial [Vulcanimicrobiaceae bacterium]